jgi:tetratricopeptide (TPR) repeat protein
MDDLDIPSFFAWAGENLQGHTGEIRAHLERPRLEAPGALYPPPEAFIDATGPRCDKKNELRKVFERWDVDRRALDGRALAARNGMGFLHYLDEIGTDGELSRSGATWVSPSIVDLLFVGGFCAIERTDLKSAQQYFEAASSLDPNNAMIRMELAHVWIQRSDFAPAEEQIEFVLATSQDPCVIAQALRKRGFIELERGELSQAYTTYTESLDHEPGSELARRELALLYQAMESQGFEELPPLEYIPPPSTQLTTQCTL